MDKVSISYLFSLSKYQTKCVKFLFRQLMTEKKRGEDGNTKLLIYREQKELFRWNKKNIS